MKTRIITLLAAILVATTSNIHAQAPQDPIQQAFNSLRGNKDLPPETQQALVAAVEAMKLPPITVKTDRDREIICNRFEACSARYQVRGDNMTEEEKTTFVTKVHAAHAAGIAGIKGQSVVGDRQEHIEQLLRILGHVHMDAVKKVKYADVTRGYYAMAIRAIAGAPAPQQSPAPAASAPSVNVQVNNPPVPSSNPNATSAPAPSTAPSTQVPPERLQLKKTSVPAGPAK